MQTVEIVRSHRKSVSIEIKRDLNILVRAPLSMPDSRIQAFLKEKSAWIEKHAARIAKQNASAKENSVPKFTAEEMHTLTEKAKQLILPRVEYYADRMGVHYGKITIRAQTTRWGSCSSKGNLNFNVLLALFPQDVLDYIVVHELCHRLEMNHSQAFWNRVAAVYPDYQISQKWLKEHEADYIRRLPNAK